MDGAPILDSHVFVPTQTVSAFSWQRRFRTTWQYPLPAPAPDPWYAAVNMQSTISTGAASYAENAAARAETALKSAELRGSASPYQTIRTNYG